MSMPRLETDRDLMLYYLGAPEIDSFFVEQLRRIDGIGLMLIDVVEGRVEASHPQVKAAIYVLGFLGEPAALVPLASMARSGPLSRQLAAMLAIGAIGPDQSTCETLMGIARDTDADPAAVAFAMQALGRTGDPEIATHLRERPPAHAHAPVVREAVARLNAT